MLSLEITNERFSFKFFLYTVISFSAKMVEIRVKTVENAQFNFRHQFWPNFFQFGRNSTHDWFYLRRFGLDSASL
jgi:hypothetical protein